MIKLATTSLIGLLVASSANAWVFYSETEPTREQIDAALGCEKIFMGRRQTTENSWVVYSYRNTSDGTELGTAELIMVDAVEAPSGAVWMLILSSFRNSDSIFPFPENCENRLPE